MSYRMDSYRSRLRARFDAWARFLGFLLLLAAVVGFWGWVLWVLLRKFQIFS